MYFDGSLMNRGTCAGLVFVSPLGVRMRYMIHLHFPSSNNVSEYEALVNGLRNAIELGIRRNDIRGDSQLIINQVMKESSCHDTKMVTYCQEDQRLEDRFDGLELNHVPRRLNEAADALAKAASGREPVPTGVFASDQHKPSVRYEGSERANNGSSDPAPGLTNQRLRPTPRSWSLKKARRPTLRTTREHSTSTTSSTTICQRIRRKLDGSHATPSPSFL